MSCECLDDGKLLKLIQGDTFNLNVTFSGDAAKYIKSVTFSSRILNITQDLEPMGEDNTRWTFLLADTQTAALQPCRADFDLTITFVDDSICTALYRYPITIIKKVNEVEEE